jgi:hypothetical protein
VGSIKTGQLEGNAICRFRLGKSIEIDLEQDRM